MKKINLLFVLIIFGALSVNAQIAINTDGSSPNPTSMLDVKASDKGILIPRLALVSATKKTSKYLNHNSLLLITFLNLLVKIFV